MYLFIDLLTLDQSGLFRWQGPNRWMGDGKGRPKKNLTHVHLTDLV